MPSDIKWDTICVCMIIIWNPSHLSNHQLFLLILLSYLNTIQHDICPLSSVLDICISLHKTSLCPWCIYRHRSICKSDHGKRIDPLIFHRVWWCESLFFWPYKCCFIFYLGNQFINFFLHLLFIQASALGIYMVEYSSACRKESIESVFSCLSLLLIWLTNSQFVTSFFKFTYKTIIPNHI